MSSVCHLIFGISFFFVFVFFLLLVIDIYFLILAHCLLLRFGVFIRGLRFQELFAGLSHPLGLQTHGDTNAGFLQP